MKIQVLTKQNYRTEVLVDNKFVYESFLHGRAETENLKKLVHALGLDVEITDRLDKDKI
jgi:hypothetical protein